MSAAPGPAPGPAPGRDPLDVRSLSLTYPDGYRTGSHSHDWAQLIHARSGVMRVEVAGQVWLIPPSRALWIPAATSHAFTTRGEVAFRTLYIAPARSAAVRRGVEAFEVSPLLRELILHIMVPGTLDPRDPAQDRLAGLLIDLIGAAQAIDLMLPQPRDPRALRLARRFQDHPEDRNALARLAETAGASVRTLQRSFIAETGMSVEAWRQKARLIAATADLANGRSVTTAALDCGYDSVSAFIAAFKRQFHITPGQFARRR